MKSRGIGSNLAIMIVFIAVGLTMFTEGVRTVQILGLMASGAAAGAGLTRLIEGLRSKAEKAN